MGPGANWSVTFIRQFATVEPIDSTAAATISTDARISQPPARSESVAAQASPSSMNPCHSASRWHCKRSVCGTPGFRSRALVMTNPNAYAVARLSTPPTMRIFADVSTEPDATRASDPLPGPGFLDRADPSA